MSRRESRRERLYRKFTFQPEGAMRSAITVEQDRIRYDSLYSLEIVRRVADELMKQE